MGNRKRRAKKYGEAPAPSANAFYSYDQESGLYHVFVTDGAGRTAEVGAHCDEPDASHAVDALLWFRSIPQPLEPKRTKT
jgi:hypothetical protein